MGVQVIPIPTEVVSHSSHSRSQFCVLFPFPWDSQSQWESHSHAHLYCQQRQDKSKQLSNYGSGQQRSLSSVTNGWGTHVDFLVLSWLMTSYRWYKKLN